MLKHRYTSADGGLRTFLAELMVVLGIAVLGLVGSIAGAAIAMATQGPATIKMADKAPFYSPDKVTIKAGQTVEWVNDGKTVHSVTTVPADARNPKDVELPKGAQGFDSGFIPPGGKFSYTFKVPGTYKYFCVPHENAGMTGYVVVKK
jgi:plastocyanin